MTRKEISEHVSGPSRFMTTAWSVVARAQDRDGDAYRQSISRLCQTYWKPVYNFIRRRGLPHDQAWDAVQEYFTVFLEKGFVEAADRKRGKFRTFILTTVSRFLSKHRRKHWRENAHLSINIPVEAGEYEVERPGLEISETPEDEFNRSWARSLVANTLVRMREACQDGNKVKYLEVFEAYLDSMTDVEPLSYRELGEKLELSENDITNYLHRGRNIFQKLLREEIRESVLSENEVDEEIESLRRYFG